VQEIGIPAIQSLPQRVDLGVETSRLRLGLPGSSVQLQAQRGDVLLQGLLLRIHLSHVRQEGGPIGSQFHFELFNLRIATGHIPLEIGFIALLAFQIQLQLGHLLPLAAEIATQLIHLAVVPPLGTGPLLGQPPGHLVLQLPNPLVLAVQFVPEVTHLQLRLGALHLDQIADVALGGGTTLTLGLGLIQESLQVTNTLLQSQLILLQGLQLLAMQLAIGSSTQSGHCRYWIGVGQFPLELLIFGPQTPQVNASLHQLGFQFANPGLVDNIWSTCIARTLNLSLTSTFSRSRRGLTSTGEHQVLITIRGRTSGGNRLL